MVDAEKSYATHLGFFSIVIALQQKSIDDDTGGISNKILTHTLKIDEKKLQVTDERTTANCTL